MYSVYRMCVWVGIAAVLSACGRPIVTQKQYMEPRFARLVLPLTESQQHTQVIKLSTSGDNKIVMEQHAFSGGRVSVIFDFRYPVTFYSGKAEILTRIMQSPFVVDFIGANPVMDTVKDHYENSIVTLSPINPDAGGTIKYALVTNPQKTKVCAVFTMSLHSTDSVMSSYLLGYKSTVIDGALCNSTRQKNILAMEQYAKEFITVIVRR